MTVVYEDNHIIIVNKTASEIVQGDKTGDTPLSETVKQYLKEKYNKPGNVFIGVTHRLDRPVSGLVVFAKTSKALSRLNDMFRRGEVEKSGGGAGEKWAGYTGRAPNALKYGQSMKNRPAGLHCGAGDTAGPENPLTLKEQIWKETSARLGIKAGGMKGMGLRVPAEIGDPMQIAVAAYAAALPEDVKITLAGGTQMMAVAAILRDMGFTRDILVATTKYVHIDPTSCLEEYAEKIGVRWYAAPLDFTYSRFPGLADYEKGFIKEGVGAGGAVWYAQQLGVSMERIQSKTEELYEKMLNEGPLPPEVVSSVQRRSV